MDTTHFIFPATLVDTYALHFTLFTLPFLLTISMKPRHFHGLRTQIHSLLFSFCYIQNLWNKLWVWACAFFLQLGQFCKYFRSLGIQVPGLLLVAYFSGLHYRLYHVLSGITYMFLFLETIFSSSSVETQKSQKSVKIFRPMHASNKLERLIPVQF